ncbi:hypothetical protein LTR17_001602 [Elasticomyces elasticus]|nr:hypothetical protein LTR17_001602 [Elasticomyces elasticus]
MWHIKFAIPADWHILPPPIIEVVRRDRPSQTHDDEMRASETTLTTIRFRLTEELLVNRAVTDLLLPEDAAARLRQNLFLNPNLILGYGVTRDLSTATNVGYMHASGSTAV